MDDPKDLVKILIKEVLLNYFYPQVTSKLLIHFLCHWKKVILKGILILRSGYYY